MRLISPVQVNSSNVEKNLVKTDALPSLNNLCSPLVGLGRVTIFPCFFEIVYAY